MKKLLIAMGLGLALASSVVQAADKIAVVNVENVFQQVVKKTGTEQLLDNEFKGRASELQKMQTDLQSKIEKLQKEGPKMKAADRSKMEKTLMGERDKFLAKAQQYEQDHSRRTNEERSKILGRISAAVKKVAESQKLDIVLNSASLLYQGGDVKDISTDVSNQVK